MKSKSALLIAVAVVSLSALLLGAIPSARRAHASGSNTSAACAFAVAPASQSFLATGGSGTANVTTGTGCTWTTISAYPWITITSGQTGTGSAAVGYTVAANAGVSNRIGSLLIAGQFVSISQSGTGMNCPVTPLTIPQTVNGSLSASDCRSVIDTGTYADLYSFSAQAGQRVAISLSSTQFDAYLILIAPDGSTIAGNDDSNSSVSTDSRIPPGTDFFVLPISGTYVIDASSFSSNEVGTYSLSLTAATGQSCTYAVTPMSQAFTASGGNGSANVTTSAGCGWQTGSDASWITPSGATSGAGSGTINYSVAVNISLGYRIGRVLIAGQVVTVVQAGTGGNCPITSLVLPQSINGSWTLGECTSGSGSLADLYSFSGQAGQQVAISLTTTTSFTSIYIYMPTGLSTSVEGDGNLRFPSGTGAFVLPFTGAYIVEAGAGGVGSYTLGIATEQAQACAPVIGLNANRLCNPGAELGQGGTTETEIVSIPGWTTTSNFTVTHYGVSVLPTVADSERISGGSNFFAGGPNNANSTATQTVDVSDEATGIDAGQRTAQLQGYLGGYPGDNDTATVRVEYLNSAGAPIGTQLLIGPTNGSLHLVSNSGAIPAGTRGIRVTLVATRVDGSYADAFFDNVSLSLNQTGGTVCPTITNLSPVSGVVGSTVTITGTNFTGVTAVKFASSVTAQFTVNSATQITATVPAGAVTGPITLSKASCADTLTSVFTVTGGGGNCVTAPTGAIAWLAGDGNANDLAGSNHGTLQNGATFTSGLVGQAFSLDGSNDVVQVPDSPSLDFGAATPLTVELWAYRTGSNPIMHLVGKRVNCDVSAFNYQLALNTTNSEGLSFGGTTGKVNTGVNLALNTWTHLAGTFDGTTFRLYINGQLAGSAAGPLGPANNAPLMIGGSGSCQTFAGLLDEVTLYNRALSAGEIQTIFNANSAGKCKTTPSSCATISFASPTNFSTGAGPYSIAVGDFNADGKLDAATSNSVSNNVSVLLGAGNGGLGVATNYSVGLDPGQIATGDVNGDGKLDLLVVNNDSDNISVLLGTGTGSFSSATNFVTVASPTDLALGDYNSDGKLDAAVSCRGGNSVSVSVLLGSGTGSFSAPTNFMAGPEPFRLVTGDLNGDGKLDLAVVNYDPSSISILLGNGSGGFSAPTSVSGGGSSYDLAIGDLNVDGKLDLVVSNDDENNVAVLLGNGSGGFSAPVTYPVGTEPDTPVIGDFNGDGKQDVTVTNFGSNNVSTLLGNGNGSLGAAVNFVAGLGPEGSASGDFNGDSKRDLIVTSYDSGSVSVLLNNCTTTTICPSIANLNPASGVVGNAVTITGTNFTGATAVRFANNVGASFTVNSATQITATVPNGAVTGPITISKTGCNDVQTATFTVSTPQCISVTISTGLTGASGGSLTVPITVSDTTGRAAISYDLTLTFDPAVLRLQTTPYDRTGTLSAGMNITTNTSVSGQLILSAFGANALTGTGTLINLKFDVIGAGSSCSNLAWTSFRFNEGTPCSTTANGRACAVGGSIGGTVSYCITPKPVPGVVVSAAGTPSAMSTTTSAGAYQLTGLGAGPYTVTPLKTGDANGIASFDAALIAQHAVMLTTLNSCQQVAADSSGDGGISSFDAALAAQFAVGIPNASSKVGTWKFVPPSRNYPTLTGDQTNQNYDAVLVGDVSGNWATGAAVAEAQPQQDELLAQQNVQVALPELVAGAATSLILPITVSDLTGRGVLAYDFDLIFNASLLEAQGQPVDATDTLSSSFTVTPNATPGRLRVSGFGTIPLSGSGVLLKLRFNVIGAVGNNTTLTWQTFQFNEGSPTVTAVPGRVTVINIYTLSLTPSSQTVPIGSSASLTLVSSVAQPIAVQYPVISSNPGVASVPALVTIPANTTMTTFAVTANAVGGPVTITAGYAPLPGAPLATAMVTVVRLVTCVSASSFAGPNLASESIVAAFGNGLATSTAIGATIPLPTQLAGTTLSVRDSLGVSRLAPLFFVSDLQINFQIPAGTALGTAIVTATSGIGTVSSGAISIVKVAPGLFTANADGGGVPAAYIIRVKPNGQQIQEDVLVLNQQTARFVPKEIDLTISGDRVFLILFGTGIRFYDSISSVVVRFGNEDQPVDAALPQGFFVGLDQVNVELVRSKIPPGPVTATLRVDGIVARSVDLLVK